MEPGGILVNVTNMYMQADILSHINYILIGIDKKAMAPRVPLKILYSPKTNSLVLFRRISARQLVWNIIKIKMKSLVYVCLHGGDWCGLFPTRSDKGSISQVEPGGILVNVTNMYM